MYSLNNKIIRLINKTKKGFSNFCLLCLGAFKRTDADNGRMQTDLDKKLVFSQSRSKIPSLKQVKYLKKFLNPRETWLMRISFSIIFICLIFLGVKFYKSNLVIIPVKGGEYVEGLIGSAKYINPLYANFSDVDSDISSLIFSSLLKRDGSGSLKNDLAAEYSESDDHKAYYFKIRNDVKWHNNSPLTVDDIIFTFNTIKDKRYNSPLERGLQGVEIEKVDESAVKFILSDPYAGFLELLTFGIIPQDIWYQITPNSAGLSIFNLKPVGSGPYKFTSFEKEERTGQLKAYNIKVNDNYYGAHAFINKITFKFFPNFEEAIRSLNAGQIDGISYLPKHFEPEIITKDSLNFYNLNIPQLTAIFFNQSNNSFLADKLVRQALALAINKNKIVDDVFQGNARIIDGPILPNNFAYNKENKKYNYNNEEAKKMLENAGWKVYEITEADIAKAQEEINSADEKMKKDAEDKIAMGTGKWRRKEDKFLTIKLTAVEADVNQQVIDYIKKFWEDIGIKTNIDLISANQIEINVIRPRKFEALFYGQMLGADPDLYVFWHSSQADISGLNLSNYKDKDVDLLLEDARIISNLEERKEKYKKFQEIIMEDLPAIFLYSPTYTYLQAKKVKGFNAKDILFPYDRFSEITSWYLETGRKLNWR